MSRKRRTIPIWGDIVGEFESWCCGIVTNADLKDIYTDNQNVNNVVDEVKKSVITDHASLVQINKAFQNFSTQSVDRFNNLKQALQTFSSSTHSEEYLLFHLMMHMTQLHNAELEIIHLMDILSHCNSHKMSTSAVSSKQFMDQLQKFEMQALHF